MKRWQWPLSAGSGAASRPAAMPDQPLFTSDKAQTSAEGAKNGYIFLVAAVVPFVLVTILALGVGYFFAGFQGFTWSVPG